MAAPAQLANAAIGALSQLTPHSPPSHIVAAIQPILGLIENHYKQSYSSPDQRERLQAAQTDVLLRHLFGDEKENEKKDQNDNNYCDWHVIRDVMPREVRTQTGFQRLLAATAFAPSLIGSSSDSSASEQPSNNAEQVNQRQCPVDLPALSPLVLRLRVFAAQLLVLTPAGGGWAEFVPLLAPQQVLDNLNRENEQSRLKEDDPVDSASSKEQSNGDLSAAFAVVLLQSWLRSVDVRTVGLALNAVVANVLPFGCCGGYSGARALKMTLEVDVLGLVAMQVLKWLGAPFDFPVGCLGARSAVAVAIPSMVYQWNSRVPRVLAAALKMRRHLAKLKGKSLNSEMLNEDDSAQLTSDDEVSAVTSSLIYGLPEDLRSAVERRFADVLLRASLNSESRRTKSGLLDLLGGSSTTRPESVLEGDGSPLVLQQVRGGNPGVTSTTADGQQARRFFTLLNFANPYSGDQTFNISLFSCLRKWISSTHAQELVGSSYTCVHCCFGSARKARSLSRLSRRQARRRVEEPKPRALLPDLQEAVILYCLRVLEQVRFFNGPAGAGSKPESHSSAPVQSSANMSAKRQSSVSYFSFAHGVAAAEAIRVLDLVCMLDVSVVSRVLPMIRRCSDRTASTTNLAAVSSASAAAAAIDKAAGAAASAAAGVVDSSGGGSAGAGGASSEGQVATDCLSSSAEMILSSLKFFVHHGRHVMFDVAPVFRSFLAEHVSKLFYHSSLPTETLKFLRQHCGVAPWLQRSSDDLRDENVEEREETIHGSVLPTYFPTVLKLVAWSPAAHFNDALTLLPRCVADASAQELLHAVLDLPVLASALESVASSLLNGFRVSSGLPSATRSDEHVPSNSDSAAAQPHTPTRVGERFLGSTAARDRAKLSPSTKAQRQMLASAALASPTSGQLTAKNVAAAAAMELELLGTAGEQGGKGIDALGLGGAGASAAEMRVLFNYLLRSESGLPMNFWDAQSGTAALMRQYCASSIARKAFKTNQDRDAVVAEVASVRVRYACELAPGLLRVLLDKIVESCSRETLAALVPIMFARSGNDQLFPDVAFRRSVRRILADKIMAVLDHDPSLIWEPTGASQEILVAAKQVVPALAATPGRATSRFKPPPLHNFVIDAIMTCGAAASSSLAALEATTTKTQRASVQAASASSDGAYFAGRDEIILSLCWAIGEYVGRLSAGPEAAVAAAPLSLGNEVLNEFHEALELCIYERLSFAKTERSDVRGDQRSAQQLDILEHISVRYHGGGVLDLNPAQTALSAEHSNEVSARNSNFQPSGFSQRHAMKRSGNSASMLASLVRNDANGMGTSGSDITPPRSIHPSSSDFETLGRTTGRGMFAEEHPGFAPNFSQHIWETLFPADSHRTNSSIQQGFLTRFMLVLTTALTRLAARHQPLASRVSLSLGKLASSSDIFDAPVVEHAKFSLALLKFPSLATAALETTGRASLCSVDSMAQTATGPGGIFRDDNTSLPFILRPTDVLVEAAGAQPFQLHDFLPLDPRTFD